MIDLVKAMQRSSKEEGGGRGEGRRKEELINLKMFIQCPFDSEVALFDFLPYFVLRFMMFLSMFSY